MHVITYSDPIHTPIWPIDARKVERNPYSSTNCSYWMQKYVIKTCLPTTLLFIAMITQAYTLSYDRGLSFDALRPLLIKWDRCTYEDIF
ncbi:hypothetical protein [Niallia oryzisoli]|uniref:hypothetical protein n=1 Tax=Niallia oryzisoli TaxID=1737571 RepID=UPI003734D4AA